MNPDNNSDSNEAMPTTTGSPFDRQMARIAVGGYFDAQDVRKSAFNRVRDVVRKKRENIPFDVVEDEKDDEERDWESEYEDDELPDLIDQMLSAGQLTDREHQYISVMLQAAETAEESEQRFKSVMAITEAEPIYTEWLDHVQGVSTNLTAQLIHRFGYCEESPKVSNLWSYAGLAPGQERKRGEKLGYDPQAKTLLWKVADCMVKRGEHSEYRRRFYDPYKEEQIRRKEVAEQMTDDELDAVDWTPPNSQGHADTRARRYLAKKFAKHYWYIARDLQGLETPAEWIVTHGGHDEREDTFENPAYARKVVVGR